jgi:hypothetical protein
METNKYIGDLTNGIYTNFFGHAIKCFNCNSNKCTKQFNFILQFGGNGTLLSCNDCESIVKKECEKRNDQTTIINTKQSTT